MGAVDFSQLLKPSDCSDSRGTNLGRPLQDSEVHANFLYGLSLIDQGVGSSGVASFIAGGNFEGSTIPGRDYDDGAVAVPIDGIGGTPAGVSTAFNAVSPMVDLKDIKLTKLGVNAQGQGRSFDFSITRAYTKQILKLQLFYESDLPDDTIGIFLQDLTSGLFIPLTVNTLKKSTVPYLLSSYFQPSDNLTYRVFFHVISTNTSAGYLKLDNLIAAMRENTSSVAIGPVTAYTPTFVGLGTVTNINFKWRQVGETIRVFGTFTAGTVTAVEAQISLPNNYTTVNDLSTLQKIGSFTQSSAGANSGQVLAEASKQYVTFGFQAGATAGLAKLIGTSLSTGATYSVEFEFTASQLVGVGVVQLAQSAGPIYLSNSESTINTNGVSSKSYYGVEGAAILNNTANTLYNITLPRSLLPNETLVLEVRSKVDGNWHLIDQVIDGNVMLRPFWVGVWGSGNNDTGVAIRKVTANEVQVRFGSQVVNGATVSAWSVVTGSATGFDRWRVRVGPQNAVEIPTTVYARFTGLSLATPAVISGVTEDSHGCITTANGRFTAKLAGRYRVSGNFRTDTNSTVVIRKNGTNIETFFYLSGSLGNFLSVGVNTEINMLAGDYIDFAVSVVAPTITSVYITRVGAN